MTDSELRELFDLQQDESIEGLVDSINLNTAYVDGDVIRVRALVKEIKLRRSGS